MHQGPATATIYVSINTISCERCPPQIRLAIGKIVGVTSVKIDQTSKLAQIDFNPNAIASETIISAINRIEKNSYNIFHNAQEISVEEFRAIWQDAHRSSNTNHLKY